MKRQKRKTATKKKQPTVAGEQPARPAASRNKALGRRAFLETLGYGALGVAIVGGGSWYVVSGVQASIAEQDLSRLGNGIPTVVQTHDPQCPRCRALQREAREAVSEFEDGTIQFLVANIRQPEGRQLAAAHGVGHVTLLLFDGSGRRRGILVGENDSESLSAEFRRLIRRSGSG